MESQQQQQVAAGGTPVRVPKYISPKGMWVSKFILRVLAIVFDIVIMAIAGSMAEHGVLGPLFYIIIFPPVALSLIWNVAEGICILARGGRRGIHPGANVALDLIIWLALTVIIIILWLMGLTSYLYDLADYSYGYYGYDSYYYDGSDLVAARDKGRAITGLVSLLIILHFTLFVIACYETSVRNRMTQTVYVMPSQYPGAPPPMVMAAPQQAYGGAHQSMMMMGTGADGQPVYYQMAAPPQAHQQQGQVPVYYAPAPQQQQPQYQQPSPLESPSPMSQSTGPFLNQPNPTAPPPVYNTGNQGQVKQELPS